MNKFTLLDKLEDMKSSIRSQLQDDMKQANQTKIFSKYDMLTMEYQFINQLIVDLVDDYHRSKIDEDQVDVLINGILHQLGISASLSGYQLLSKGIHYMLTDVDARTSGITKYLYPTLSKVFNISTDCVERNIRYAISFVNRSSRLYRSIFDTTNHLSARVFMLTIVEYIKINYILGGDNDEE